MPEKAKKSEATMKTMYRNKEKKTMLITLKMVHVFIDIANFRFTIYFKQKYLTTIMAEYMAMPTTLISARSPDDLIAFVPIKVIPI